MPNHYMKKKGTHTSMGKHKTKTTSAAGTVKRRAPSRKKGPAVVSGIPLTKMVDPPQGFARLYRF
jgi:uncharacterized protein YfaP (DUF2135 family)